MTSDTKYRKPARAPCLLAPLSRHSRWVVGDDPFEGGQVLHVLVVEPLDLKVQLHVASMVEYWKSLVLCTKKK